MTADRTYTRADAKRDYCPMMRRSQVLELGRRLGLSERTVRGLIEGRDAKVQPVIYPGATHGYFDREAVCDAVFPVGMATQPRHDS